ncbi:PREDICTED: fatty-acid amide hydrolase 2 [Gekko japonicus]|uniref:Fatty-acid amide hydrolase 2 n=1 Tax=Gekko japonicus TaxID=146911 RepID=A0ABM1L7T1_GEKJA|nr:PREDICTED: fatty-acid amide hydrolase 2 [Gekko japonicus]
MARSRAERYTARVLRLLSRAFLALLGLVARASALAAPSPSPATASPPAAATTTATCPLSSPSRKVRCVPPPSNELLLVPGVELARRIRRKEVTCVNVIETYIGRIKEVNPLINAVVKDRFEAALQEAHEVDKLLAEGHDDEESLREKFPYLGVPVSIKEAFALHGMPNTSGLVNRRHIISTTDATVVSRLKQAGAIPLGVTNCSELCMWYESSNRVYGRSNNPYDLECIVGGSSGGEGSILGAAGSVIGVGSDIGGSIRMPAFFNGIFGHKPTTGVVPNDGQFPIAQGVRVNFLCTGPMCRYAEDLEPMLRIMAGPGIARLKLDEKVSLEKVKFYFMEHDGGSPFVSPVDKELLQAQRKVVENLEAKLGVEVQHVAISKMKYSLQIWSVMMSAKSSDMQKNQNFTDLLGDHGKPVWPVWELLKWTVGMSSHTFPAIALGISEKFVHYSPKVNSKLESMGHSLRTELVNLLQDDGVFLYPSHPVVAPKHHAPLGMPFNFAYTAIFNILGLPVTQCPLGLSKEGLPLGIQVVAGPHNDHLTLAMARYLEKEFGGWVCPGRC